MDQSDEALFLKAFKTPPSSILNPSYPGRALPNRRKLMLPRSSLTPHISGHSIKNYNKHAQKNLLNSLLDKPKLNPLPRTQDAQRPKLYTEQHYYNTNGRDSSNQNISSDKTKVGFFKKSKNRTGRNPDRDYHQHMNAKHKTDQIRSKISPHQGSGTDC